MATFINELRGYQPIPRNLIEDDALSMQSRFLYCIMAVKPDGWQYFEAPLRKQLHIASSRTFRKYRDELIKAGWLQSEGQGQTEKGQFSAVKYTLKAKPEPDVQKMHNGEPTDVQKLPHGNNCRTAENAQLNNNTLTQVNIHSSTSHTHTADGTDLSDGDKKYIAAVENFIHEKCGDLELRFQPLTNAQILSLFRQKGMKFSNICKVLMDIQAKQLDYIVGAQLYRLIEKFWTYDFERRKKK